MDLRNKACPHLIIQEHVIIGAKIITLNKRFICSKWFHASSWNQKWWHWVKLWCKKSKL